MSGGKRGGLSAIPNIGVELPAPLSRFIARKLGEAIEAGRYAPGERLSEDAIARDFGTSRGPVREALGQLEREELVEITPRRGARVIEFTPEALDHMFELRAVLYALAVEGFARRASAKDLADYDRLAVKLGLANAAKMAPADFARATQTLSAFIVARSGNARLEALMRKMTRQAFRHYAVLVHGTAEHRTSTIRAGMMMRKAIGARQPKRAFALARAIVEANRRAAMAALTADRP
jgi:DNA-binding GntR family transcriptional regulator